MTDTAQTPLEPIDLLLANPPAKRPVVVLGEGVDERVVTGGIAAVTAGLADIILVGDADKTNALISQIGGADRDGVSVHDPARSELTDSFADAFFDLRKHKGISRDDAAQAVRSPLVYSAMLVRQGHADGTVSGAITTSSDVVRTAIQVVGQADDADMVSSFFLMFPPEEAGLNGRAMVYSDCGMMIDPNAEQLAAIAAASAASCKALLRQDPKIAFLSFSTKGSASHPDVDKVANAMARLQDRRPDLQADGEFQFDAAFIPSVGERKAPGSAIAGQANVMIFPNLDAGNIGYKITQRLGGYAAIGPIMQGLAKPANDLSRGCNAKDITQMVAVTVLQAMKS